MGAIFRADDPLKPKVSCADDSPKPDSMFFDFDDFQNDSMPSVVDVRFTQKVPKEEPKEEAKDVAKGNAENKVKDEVKMETINVPKVEAKEKPDKMRKDG